MSALLRTPSGSRENSVSAGSPDFASISDRSPALAKTPKRKSDPKPSGTHRESKEYKAQLGALSKENERLAHRMESAVAELTKIRSLYDSQANEMSVMKASLQKVNQQRVGLEREVGELKKYSRKLESSLATATKSALVCELSNLNAKVASLTAEKQKDREEKAVLEAEIDAVRRENERMKEAVLVKAEEFGLVGDVQAQILFELTDARKEKEKAERAVMPLEADIALLKNQLESAYITIEELKLIREANNEELNRLESSLHSEFSLRTDVEKELERSLEEKTKLLRLLDELDRRCSALKSELAEEQRRKTEREERETQTNHADVVAEKEETMRNLKENHRREVESLREIISSLETSLSEAKSALIVPVPVSSPPIAPPSKPLAECESPCDSSVSVPKSVDSSRFRLLIAEEKKRTEDLIKRLKGKQSVGSIEG